MLRQTEVQISSEFILNLQKQALKCEFGGAIDDMPRDQLVIGIGREDIRRKLLANDKLTMSKVIEVINIEDEVEKDSSYFRRVHV